MTRPFKEAWNMSLAPFAGIPFISPAFVFSVGATAGRFTWDVD